MVIIGYICTYKISDMETYNLPYGTISIEQAEDGKVIIHLKSNGQKKEKGVVTVIVKNDKSGESVPLLWV